MRKILLSLTAVAGLFAAGVATSAAAAPVGIEVAPAASMVQPVQYYYGDPNWRARRAYWHHRRWERHRYHRWLRHHYYRGW